LTVATDDDDLAAVGDAYAFRAVPLAIRRPIRRVLRHQDLAAADADPHPVHVEKYVRELGTSHAVAFLVTPQRGR
jgi:hypothetical protein